MNSTRDLLASHRLKCTVQRLAVYGALRSTKSHPTADELFDIARAQADSLCLTTVYSILDTFCRVGLARRLPTPGGSCRYDADMSPHVHIRFADTGQITDVPDDLGQRLIGSIPRPLLRQLTRRLGVEIEGLNIQIIARSRPAD